MPYGKKDSAMKMKGSWMSKHIQNLFKEMPIDNKASALEMDKGSAAYMKDDMKGDTPLAKHTKAQGLNLNPGLVSAIHMHDDFTKKNNIKHK